MKLVVRNMVCDRCKVVVRRVLGEQGLRVLHVDLGEVELEREPDYAQLEATRAALKAEGFELVLHRIREPRIIGPVRTVHEEQVLDLP